MVKKEVAMTVVRRRVGVGGILRRVVRGGRRNMRAAVVYKRSNCGGFELEFAIVFVGEAAVDNIAE